MAIDDEVSCNTNIEKHFSRLIDNVESCFSRMDKEKYRWDFMESNLSHIYNNLPESVQDKYKKTYLEAISKIETAKDFKSEKY
ncbi:hypothetical protein HOA91_05335 [Candidatus Woesearchaeota archaeon]|jgi:hypothetical protein|nr:hypothetical protein [Candidatus Woesearchaeota archaeon]